MSVNLWDNWFLDQKDKFQAIVIVPNWLFLEDYKNKDFFVKIAKNN